VNATLLIDAIVRQTTVLIAQLATSGGLRAPLAHVANQVFLDLANELDAQGVSRKISADMFGMALRAYRKKIQRLSESSTHRDRSLWESVLEYIETNEVRSRQEVLMRFRHDDETQVRGVLHDLVESGLVAVSGGPTATVYRCTTDEEQQALQRAGAGLEELLWVIIYREGRHTADELAKKCGQRSEALLPALERLRTQNRIELLEDGRYRARSFAVPLGAKTGWEGAVFDHYHALVKTMCLRLQALAQPTSASDRVGGSTYTFKVWPAHPHHEEVLQTLAGIRERLTALRAKVESWNDANPSPTETLAVTVYAGQCAIEQSSLDIERSPINTEQSSLDTAEPGNTTDESELTTDAHLNPTEPNPTEEESSETHE
jgi:hypothetical protein